MDENVWIVRAGSGGYLAEHFAKGFVAISFGNIGDLSDVTDREAIRKRYVAAHPEAAPGKIGNSVAMIFKFRSVMKKGDHVITYDPGERIYLVGQIDSDYYYNETQIPDQHHLRKVRWKHRVSRDDLTATTRNSLGSTLTIFSLSLEAWEDFQKVIRGEKKNDPKAAEDEAIDFEDAKRNTIEEAREFLKDKLLQLDEYEMQELLAALLRAMGYKTRVSAVGPDRGKDVFASPDGLGFVEPRIKAEVKHRRNSSMGAPEVRSFIGGLRPGDRGLYLSTGGFSKEAKYEAERANIPVALVDLDELARLVEEHYEEFDTDGRALVPLTKIYWPSA